MNVQPIFRADIERNSREEVRVVLEGIGTRFTVDVRVWADAKFGTVCSRVPTKAGASIDARRIPDLIAALEGARLEAERLGLLEETR